MTGVGDILWASRRAARLAHRHAPTVWALFCTRLMWLAEALLALTLPPATAAWISWKLLPEWWHAKTRAAQFTHHDIPRHILPDCRETLRRLREQTASDRAASAAAGTAHSGVECKDREERSSLRWALLLPLTSRLPLNEEGCSDNSIQPQVWEQTVWTRLEANLLRLVDSVSTHHRARTRAYVALDMRDPVYDNDEARARIRAYLHGLEQVVFVPPLVPAYQGALCWIWALLAKHAVDEGADLFVLLGDDVTMCHDQWQADVEARFVEIAAQQRLPFGCGCVAVQDESFPGFPTFPVMHRLHLEIFGGELFPSQFRNQHGDPFLFEVYRRWGAARFTDLAKLVNGVGGAGMARYEKVGQVAWRGAVLTKAVEHLSTWLDGRGTQVACLDVVIPTYRCDLDALAALTRLDCQTPASVQTIVVVDNPKSANLDRIKSLVSYAANRTVRVDVMVVNGGASHARNQGMAQSFGDYCVLLDDDVVPEPGLLDAYLGAIERQPGASAYVGLTILPAPQTLVERAMVASRICYFYGIAAQTRSPPWGVTANLCVRGRTNNTVRFSGIYPKTGGGEDVDFCIRAQLAGLGPLVSVPEARVLHPFWRDPLKQVCGWANGDVLCLDALPHRAFRTLPNWTEIALGCLAISRVRLAATVAVLEIILLLPRFYHNAPSPPGLHRLLEAMVATAPPMLQDWCGPEA